MNTLRAVALAAFTLAAVVLPGAAQAAPPGNDAFVSAVSVASLPFSDAFNVSEATTEAGEPSGGCYFPGKTVWYVLQPAGDLKLRARATSSSFFGTVLNIYHSTGPGIGSLSFVACAFPGNAATVQLSGGQTYYVQAGAASFDFGGPMTVTLEEVLPPANDDFAAAEPVSTVPFSATVDGTAATVEPGEPIPSCGFGPSPGTVWYAFTPSETGSYSASAPSFGVHTQLAAYVGSDLGSLSQLGCRVFGGLVTFRAEAGATYYLQLGGLFGSSGPMMLNVDVAPDPFANFGFSPGDPSIFDTIAFSDFSGDPGGVGIESQHWSFGDGSEVDGCCPSHRYSADGSYEVTLTVTTFDGRSASTVRQIEVSTHDVAISKLLVPQAASAGQTKTITVGISNRRYHETVRVDLYRSGPAGYVLVGSLTQSAPVRSGGRTTDFRINYTFTSEDASLGKVTLKAVATILGARDALPADNEAVGLPTKVNG